MTLPFDKDNKTRKWQCFICGKNHHTFEDFNTHIKENHEEGRDFVLCPLIRCQACVRDVAAHFKAKHSTEPIPKTGPMKAIIWRDKSQQGRLKTRKPQFRDGYLLSIKNGGAEMHYRSSLECSVYECLEALPEVSKYNVEPIAIPYLFQGKMHTYFPDLSIHYNDGSTEIVEVKPASQTALPVNEAKWDTAAKFCAARGWQFSVWTEIGLNKLRKKVRLSQVLNEEEKQQV